MRGNRTLSSVATHRNVQFPRITGGSGGGGFPVLGSDPAASGENGRVPPVIDVRDLHVRFGEVEAVAGIDLVADAGQATALLGRNGGR